MMKRRTFILGSAAIPLLAACDSAPAQKPPAPSTTLKGVYPSKASIEAVVRANRNYRIGVLFPFQGVPFWVNEAYGIFDQAAKAGATLIWRSADGYENVARQVSQLAEMKALKVDAVLLAATNFSGTRAAVEDLIASGIPVVNHVTSTDSPKVSSRVLVDYVGIGRQQAKYLIGANPSGGEIIMLNGPAGAEWSGNEIKGFKAEISRIPSFKIVAERNSNPERISAQRFIEDLLVRFPNVSAIFSVTDSLAMGALDALKSAGKLGKVTVTTAGFSQETLEPVRAGNIALNVDESPILIGRAAVNACISVLNGKTVDGLQFAPTPGHTKGTLGNFDPLKQWAPADWKLP